MQEETEWWNSKIVLFVSYAGGIFLFSNAFDQLINVWHWGSNSPYNDYLFFNFVLIMKFGEIRC